MLHNLNRGRTLIAAVAFAACSFGAAAMTPAAALDKLVVGKPTPTAYSFSVLEVGIQNRIFEKYGLEIETVTAAGGAKLHQAMVAGSLDIALGSGPDFGFIVKGAPEKGVAAMAGPLLNIGMFTRQGGGITSVGELKGKRIGMSTVGSITDWAARQFVKEQGWDLAGTPIVPLGGVDSIWAALLSGNVDAVASSLDGGLELEDQGRVKTLLTFGDIVKTFLTHVIFATDNTMEKHPDELKRFLKGWFETIDYVRKNKADTIRITRGITKLSEPVAERVYDIETPMFLTNGRFDQAALDATMHSLVELGDITAVPPNSALISENYLP